jgi:hypothetical protein
MLSSKALDLVPSLHLSVREGAMTGEMATHDMDSSFGEEFPTLSKTLVPLTVRLNQHRFVN